MGISMEAKGLASRVQFSQKAERRRLTIEALADVDGGNIVNHRFVQAWADSLDGEKPISLPSR